MKRLTPIRDRARPRRRTARLVALLAVGRPRDLAQGRRLIESGTPMDPSLLPDPSRPLKEATA